MEVVAGQPIKKFKFFRIPQSLYWRPSADQKARGLWVRDWPCPGIGKLSESSPQALWPQPLAKETEDSQY